MNSCSNAAVTTVVAVAVVAVVAVLFGLGVVVTDTTQWTPEHIALSFVCAVITL